MDSLGVSVAPGTLRVLRAVERSADLPGPFMGDIAESLAVDASTATRLVEQAAREGFLEKRPDTTDQRRVALRLTRRGRSLLTKANKVRHDLLDEVTSDWPAGDLHKLASLLGRLSDDLGKLEE